MKVVEASESGTVAAAAVALDPASIVVIGASPQGRGFTTAPLKNLRRHGFTGKVYAVNPKYKEIDGVPCFASVLDIPEVPEAAVLVVGARRVPAALRECAEAGVKVATVIAGGFAELGEEGKALEEDFREILRTSGLRVHGPNTAGLSSINADYVPRAALNHPEKLTKGGIALVTQSGALCNTVANRIFARGLGLSHAIATGSQWDLDQWDFAGYLLGRDDVHTVATIVEGIEEPAKAILTVERGVELGKPIIVLKPGASELGSEAVRTHSGALSGDHDVTLAVLADHGAIVVDQLDELWETAQLFDRWQGRFVDRGRLSIATYSGGDGALAVDEAERAGIECARFSDETARTLDEMYTLATAANPFDFTGEVVDRPELIRPSVEAILADPDTGVFLLAAPVWSGHFAEWIVGPALEAAAQGDVPFAVSLWSAKGVTDDAERLVLDAGFPLFDGSPSAVRAIARYRSWTHGRDRFRRTYSAVPAARSAAAPSGKPRVTSILGYWESRSVLGEAGLTFNSAEAVTDEAELRAALQRIGLPVTLKASAASIVHKAAKGAVRLCIASEDEAVTVLHELVALADDVEVTVEKYLPSAAAILLGGQRSESFGPVLVVGLGGGYAEAFHDVAHAECPLSPEQAAALFEKTTVFSAIRGNRLAVMGIVDQLVAVSHWFARKPSIVSFDVNPILVGLDGSVTAVDARVESGR